MIRVPDHASYQVITQKMQRILKHPHITFTITDETPAFNVNKISRPVIGGSAHTVDEFLDLRTIETRLKC
jgi:hypothetical protein